MGGKMKRRRVGGRGGVHTRLQGDRSSDVCSSDLIVVIAYRRLPDVNPTTVALTFLLVVLLLASRWGLTVAITTAVVATLAFNYYFLPPIHTFTIADPQNWIALLAFLTSAIVASRLAERARREALNATRRRKEVERLYSLSQQLLATH